MGSGARGGSMGGAGGWASAACVVRVQEGTGERVVCVRARTRGRLRDRDVRRVCGRRARGRAGAWRQPPTGPQVDIFTNAWSTAGGCGALAVLLVRLGFYN